MYRDRVEETTTVTGTGPAPLSGGVPVGFRSIAAAYAVGESFPYVIDGGAEWEVGLGTRNNAGQVERTTVTASSNNGAPVNFSAGTKRIYSAASGACLDSGLVDPDDVGFDIVALVGQSGICGRGASDALVDFGDSRLFQWDGSKIISGADPLYHTEGVATGKVGPGTWLAKAYMAQVPTNRRVLLVPCGVGGSSIIGGTPTWFAGTPGGTNYETAITKTNAAIAAAKVLYPNSRFVGIGWHLGETDADNSVSQAAFAAGLKAVIAGFRARITGAADSWVIIGGMCPEVITAGAVKYTPIDLAHKQVAVEIDRAAFVAGPTGQKLDAWHYTAQGSRILGTRMGLAVRAARRSIGTDVAGVDTTAPTLSNPTSTATSSTTLSGSVSTNESTGTLYFLVSTSSAATAAAVKAGSSQAVATTGVQNVSTTGQAASTTYYLHYLHRDASGNDSAVLSSASAITPATADTTAPTLSSPTGAATGTTTASGSVTTNEANGTLYALASVNPTETAATIKASSNTQAITSAGSKAVSATGLTASTTYYWHFVHRDAAGNDSNVIHSTSFATSAAGDTTAPILSSPTGAQTGATTANGSVGTNEANGTLYRYVSTNAVESAVSVKAANLTSPVTATGEQVVNATGLTASTTYYWHFVHTDAAGNDSNVANSAEFTTAASGGVTYTTLSTTDKDASITLSNGNRTATGTTSGFKSARGAHGKTAGKWYWEVKLTAGTAIVGVGLAGAPLTTFVGGDTTSQGIGYYSNGNRYFKNIAATTPYATYAVNGVVGIALDMDAGTLEFFTNGVSQGQIVIVPYNPSSSSNAPTLQTGAAFPMVTPNGAGSAVLCNFGATPFAYTPPAGFSGLTA